MAKRKNAEIIVKTLTITMMIMKKMKRIVMMITKGKNAEVVINTLTIPIMITMTIPMMIIIIKSPAATTMTTTNTLEMTTITMITITVNAATATTSMVVVETALNIITIGKVSAPIHTVTNQATRRLNCVLLTLLKVSRT